MSVSNWANTYAASPGLFFEPSSIDEVASILSFARARGLFVRIVGALRSPNDCAMADGVRACMVSLRRLATIHSIDKATGRVVVDGGALTSDINVALDNAGLALPNLGSISAQTLAGAMATGTHGTGASYGILAANVVRIWLLTARGELLTLDARERPVLFRAALCSLGLLGVIVRLELQAVPAFHLQVTQTPSTLSAVLADLPKRAVSAQYYRFHWYPHTDHVTEWRADAVEPLVLVAKAVPGAGAGAGAGGATAAAVTRWARGWSEWLLNYGFGYYALEAALYVAARTRATWLTPKINALWFWVLSRKPTTSCVRSFDAFNFNCLFQQ